MRCPSKKRLMAEFNGKDSRILLTKQQASLIRRLAHATEKTDTVCGFSDVIELENIINLECPATAAYARQCYNSPYDSHMWRVTMALHAIDKILGTCGVESMGPKAHHSMTPPPFEYCNAGDAYAATLIYTRKTDTLRIGCWADIVETHDKKREW